MSPRSRRCSPEGGRNGIALALLLAACLTGAAPAAAREAPSARELREQARSLLDRGGYQSELPLGEEPARAVEAPWLLPVGFVARLLAYVLAGAAVLLAAMWVWQWLERLRASPEERTDPAGQASQAERELLLEDPDRLAGEGRWAEAVHALLLRAIRHLSERAAAPPPASRTSRELLRTLPLRGEAREAFAGLVRDVELSRFGGLPLGPEEYRRSRERFQTLRSGAA